MAGKNGTATLTKARSLSDYQLDMQLSKMSAPQTARFLRLKSILKQAQDTEDFDALADAIEGVVGFARARVRRKDGKVPAADEIEWVLETMPMEDLMGTFGGKTDDAAVPPTNGTN